MNLRILPSALADLDRIDAYLIEEFGVAVADRVQSKLFSAFEQLAEFPQIGRARPDVTSRPVRFFLVKPYWIVYSPKTDLIVHRVYHAARDLNRLEEK